MKQTVKMCIWAICAAALVCCMAACPTEPGEEKGSDPKVLKVTGEIASGVVGVSLLDSSSTPAAIGVLSGNTFTLYEPGTGNMPDMTKPWKGAGEYMIVLATITGQSGPIYWYTGGDELYYEDNELGGMKPYNFTKAVSEIAWDQFTPTPIPNEERKILIVNNIPAGEELTDGKAVLGVGIVSSLDDPSDLTVQVAGGFDLAATTTKTYALNEMNQDTGLPLGTPEWKGYGRYYIVLGTGMGGTPPNYVYTAGTEFGEEGGGAKKFNFNQTTSTIDWDQFREQPVVPAP